MIHNNKIKELISTPKRIKHLKSIGKSLSLSLTNQVISSATNFLLGIYLVRVLSPKDYGLYSIGFTACLFYTGIGNALFLTQMIVHTPEKAIEDRLAYTSRIFIIVMTFCLSTIIGILAMVYLGKIIWPQIAEYEDFTIAVTAASIGYLLKEFFIRNAYNMRKEHWAIVVNLTIAASMILLMGYLQYYIKKTITINSSLWICSLSYIIAAIGGYICSKFPQNSIQFKKIILDCREAFNGGVWSVVAHIIISLRTQAHIMILTSMMGPLAVAKLNASKIFVTPASMLTPALTQIFLPRVAMARHQDKNKAHIFTFGFTAILFTIAVFYSISILISFNYISEIIVGKKYDSLFWLVFGWCIYICLSALNSGLEIALIGFKLFKKQAEINAWAALLAVVLVIIFVKQFGEIGALIGLSISEFIVVLILLYGSNFSSIFWGFLSKAYLKTTLHEKQK